MHRRLLSTREIRGWASAYREGTGKWPTKKAGDIPGTVGETWAGVDNALRLGLRGLPGGSSLPQFLAEHCGARPPKLPPLSVDQILAWADAWHDQSGEWPTAASGTIPGSGEKWSAIDMALRRGARGLPGGSSLPKLLCEHRGVRNRKQLPPLNEGAILTWADAYQQRTGSWPTRDSGPIPEAQGETWMAVDMALRKGLRGLPGGSSLPVLLAKQRGVRNASNLPPLSVEQILAWADAWHERTGEWPHLGSGPIPEAEGETWSGINQALKNGRRGLPGGASLAKLLAAERGVRNKVNQPRFSRPRILAWARAHFRTTGKWPTQTSGPIPAAPGETWAVVDEALRHGARGLRGSSSLARLLDDHGAKRNHSALPPLTKKQILAWADAHFARTGSWPNVNSGPVHEAPEERWDLIDHALRQGHRGQPGGSSLLRLLVKKRGVRDPLALPSLTEEQVLAWADAYFHRTGRWPTHRSGPLLEAPGETWRRVDWALRGGKRGLPRTTLAKLLAEKRGA
jgi:hypothetical protein